ncbi:MAG: hypothetical protein F2542_01125 [Actinobacteria bacterium]|uniref:Unannotated protein n=1 Tax=freshwater metagenome TaxID=449393 RepID=A0A6J6CE97_9ZZZZ|nr:hypothetical protein [Actinomycetota bacterium]
MLRRKISLTDGQAAIASYQAGSATSQELATAVRFLLEELGTRNPGAAVELRVPPLGAVQCVAGPTHTRGTPSNVVELGPEAWLSLALGTESFEELISKGLLTASGNRSDLADLFPIFEA